MTSTFTMAAPSAVLPSARKPGSFLVPLKPPSCRWYRETADGEWAFERLEDKGTTWVVTHRPTKTVVCDYLGSLRQCRIYVGSGGAQEDLKRIQAEGKENING